jgi:lysophospholipase L1-like esterase
LKATKQTKDFKGRTLSYHAIAPTKTGPKKPVFFILGICVLIFARRPGSMAAQVDDKSESFPPASHASPVAPPQGNDASPDVSASLPMTSDPAVRILCFGDSLTYGMNPDGEAHPYGPALQARLAERGARADVVAVGHSGWRTAQMLRDADKPHVMSMGGGGPGIRAALEGRGLPDGSAAFRPFEAAVLLSGTNDLGYRTDPADVFKDLTRLHELAWRAGVRRTVAVGIPESRASRLRVPELGESIVEVNEMLEAWAPTAGAMVGALVRYVPCPAGFDDLSEDGLHFSPAGYDKLGAGLADAVGDFLVGRSLPAAESKAA